MMTDKVYLIISEGEMHLKGGNRRYFEQKLISNIDKNMKDIGYDSLYNDIGKIIIEVDEAKSEKAIEALKKVFGIVWIRKAYRCEKDIEVIRRLAIDLVKEKNLKGTFKAASTRADKKFPLNSMELSRDIGAAILTNMDGLKVDVHTPEHEVYVDIRKFAYVSVEKHKALGGMPKATNGKALCLLSGGIDSPVALYMMAKRGVKVDAIHFHSYPFTSLQALEKVKGLRDIVSSYTGDIKLYSYNMLDAYTAINQNMNVSYTTVVSRRIMMRVAKKLAHDKGYDAIITGENIGQVASQTMYGIKAIEDATDMVIFRPLIAFDKLDIIDIAKKIGTYEKSIEPFDDCCSVFSPDHPQTRPLIADVKCEEEKVDIDASVEDIYKKGELL